MFHRKIKQKMAYWFEYSDFRLKAMEEKIEKLDKKIAALSSKNEVNNAESKRD